MIAKDLNLSLKQRPVQAEDNSARKRASADPTAMPMHSTVSQKKRPTKAAYNSNKGLWVGLFGIAFVNMLFLVLAGIWLSGTPLNTSTQTNSIAARSASEISLSLNDVNRRLDEISQTLQDLQVTAKTQLQPPAAAPFDINLQLRQALSDHESSSDSAAAANNIPAAPISWRVNLGAFSSRDEALKKQQLIRTFGYHAKINPIVRDTQIVYDVALTGFSNQKSAEQVANQIMEKANLDSLWVSESR